MAGNRPQISPAADVKGSISTLYLTPGLRCPAGIPPSSQALSENQRMSGMGPCIICIEQAVFNKYKL